MFIIIRSSFTFLIFACMQKETPQGFYFMNNIPTEILGHPWKEVIFCLCIKQTPFQWGKNVQVNIRTFQTDIMSLVGVALDSPQISSGTGCWRGCISPPSPLPPCSCPQRPCRRPADWPVKAAGLRRPGWRQLPITVTHSQKYTFPF